MKYLVGHYYNGYFGTGTTGPYKVYKARNKHDAERIFSSLLNLVSFVETETTTRSFIQKVGKDLSVDR